MTNKQKAWRTQAAAVNKRRADGSKEATSRVQKSNITKIAASPSWLMQGLMIRAGLYDPLPMLAGVDYARPLPNKGGKSWFSKAWDKAKSLFN